MLTILKAIGIGILVAVVLLNVFIIYCAILVSGETSRMEEKYLNQYNNQN